MAILKNAIVLIGSVTASYVALAFEPCTAAPPSGQTIVNVSKSSGSNNSSDLLYMNLAHTINGGSSATGWAKALT
ncbi:MAG TPA: hypothetical protein VFO40_25325, partial [Chthoniobacterales bacterium]|nr:hypothetical protein [Chthoniobacterales bacterium]